MSSRAVDTLRDMAARPPSRSRITREGVDDLLWAIRQLNERNTVIADVLSRNDSAVLSEKDVDGLDEALDAIRSVYVWVSKATGPTRDDKRQSLRDVATERGVPLRLLRELNPELAALKNDEPLPAGHRLKVPRDQPRRAGSRPPAAAGNASRSGPMRGRDAVYVSVDGDTLRSIANDVFQTTLPVVRVNNPELNGIGDHALLPPGTRIHNHPPASNRRDDAEDDDDDSFEEDRPRGRRPARRGARDEVESPRYPPRRRERRRDEWDDNDNDDDFEEPADFSRPAPRRAPSGTPAPRRPDDRGRRPAFYTNGHETVAELAAKFDCTPRELIAANQDLLPYRRQDRVSADMPIYPPVLRS